MLSYSIPLATPENRNLYRITQFSWGTTVTVLATELNNGTPTGKTRRWKMMHEFSEFTLVKVDGGWSVEYHASPYLYHNKMKNGSFSCSCPRVRLKGAYKTQKDAIFAGCAAKQYEESLRNPGVKFETPAPGTLPSTPVKSWENDEHCARYDA